MSESGWVSDQNAVGKETESRSGIDTAAANHLLAQSHWWREQLWVWSSQYVAKVNMNEVSLFSEQQIIKMVVTHTKYVCDHTVPSYIQSSDGKWKGWGRGEEEEGEVKEEEEEEEEEEERKRRGWGGGKGGGGE